MLILGIETATHQVGCAIGGHEGVIALFESSRDRRHAETLVPAIQFVTKQARIGLDEIGAVAVDVGPGLYTGLRVGVAAAKAMASALRVPMVGVPSLDLLALAAPAHEPHDRRRHRRPPGRALLRLLPSGARRRAAADPSSGREARRPGLGAAGDGPGRPARRGRRAQVRVSLRGPARVELVEQALAHPSAAPLVQLAHSYALREEFVNPWDLEPVYLRRPDAEINWETRDSR